MVVEVREARRGRRGVLVGLVLVGVVLVGVAMVQSVPSWYLPGQMISVHSDADNEINGRRVRVWVDDDGTARVRIGSDKEVTGLDVGGSVLSGWWGQLTVVEIEPGEAPVDGVQPPGSGDSLVVRWTPW